jgi:Pilus formation protein N terminal region
MRHRFAITCLATAALAMGQWSTVNAGSSFKVVTAPATGQQAPTVNAGSSFRVVTAPSDAQQAQVAAPEPLPSEPVTGEPEADPVLRPSGVEQSVLLPTNAARAVSFEEPFSNIYVSNPAHVEVAMVTDHSLLLKALNEGNSEVFLYDNKGNLKNILHVFVDQFAYRVNSKPPPSADPDFKTYGSVVVHNKAKLDSQTNFKCKSNDCEFVGETTVTEPAPLPSGNYNNLYGGTAGAAPLYPPGQAGGLLPAPPQGNPAQTNRP